MTKFKWKEVNNHRVKRTFQLVHKNEIEENAEFVRLIILYTIKRDNSQKVRYVIDGSTQDNSIELEVYAPSIDITSVRLIFYIYTRYLKNKNDNILATGDFEAAYLASINQRPIYLKSKVKYI